MFFILKIFDKSVWVRRLSFLGKIDIGRSIPFQKFVLDTRYTINLLVLTVIVVFVGILVYLFLSLLFKSGELKYFLKFIRKIFTAGKLTPIPEKTSEPISPNPLDNN